MWRNERSVERKKRKRERRGERARAIYGERFG
jgi:hypothetical protein